MVARPCPLLLLAPLLLAWPGCERDPPGRATAPPVALAGPIASILPPIPGDPAKAAAVLASLAGRTPSRRELRQTFERALDADPACTPALIDLGWFLLEDSIDRDPGIALRCFVEARLALASGLGDEANDPVARACAAAGEGVALAFNGDPAAAERLLRAAVEEQAVAAAPGRAALVHGALGDVFHETGRAADAEAPLRRAIELVPADPIAATFLARLAEVCIDTGRAAEAEPLVRDAIRRNPEHLKSHYLLFRLLTKAGRAEEAAHAQRIHELLRQLKDPTGARLIKDLERRVRLRAELVAAWPDCGRIRLGHVEALLDARRFADAEAACTGTLKAVGPSAELAFSLARARAGQGNLKGAAQARDLMWKQDPKLPWELDRAILEEWRNGAPGVTAGQIEAKLAEWGAR